MPLTVTSTPPTSLSSKEDEESGGTTICGILVASFNESRGAETQIAAEVPFTEGGVLILSRNNFQTIDSALYQQKI